MASLRPLAAALAVLLLAGCGSSNSAATDAEVPTAPEASTAIAVPAAHGPLPFDQLDRPSCPAESDNCEEAAGQIAYVERVDPDGDGDAHFVLISTDGITAPGISVIDVAANLRPHPLPRRGDLLAAAGPVYPGSYGQHQIQATAVDAVRVR
jgi:hypothetical protein